MRGLLVCGVVAGLLAGCAFPDTVALRQREPNAQFSVAAPLECLYERASEKTVGTLLMTEPQFSSYINAARTDAYFKQPLTLVELRSTGPTETLVTREQTGSAALLGQANDLLAYLRANPCS